MSWKVPTHNLICGDADGNIALQVSGLTPDRDGWNGRLPVPGTGKYEWKGFRSDLPREMNPARGYIATANDNTHPPGYEGRPVFYHSTEGVATSRITRLHQILGVGKDPVGRGPSADPARRLFPDGRARPASLQRVDRENPEAERARAMIAAWDGILTRETTAGAMFVRWDGAVDKAARTAKGSEQHALIEAGLVKAMER